MKMRIPKGHTPIVNHNNFTDARPTLGGSSTTYDPAGAMQAAPMANGPMRYPPGEPRVQKNVARGLNNGNVPY